MAMDKNNRAYEAGAREKGRKERQRFQSWDEVQEEMKPVPELIVSVGGYE